MSRLKTWSLAALGTISVIAFAILFLDRPIASLCYIGVRHAAVSERLTRTPGFFIPLAVLLVAIFLLRRATFRPLSRLDAVLALCEISVLATYAAVSSLKLALGRTWPLYHHPSFLIDGAYGFNLFKAGPQFQSFPSGHMAAICALVGVLWVSYERFRALYAAAIAVLTLGLIGGDYHFISDVIAGGFVGASIANFTVSLFQARVLAMIPSVQPSSTR